MRRALSTTATTATTARRRVLSGIQPTGVPHLGNYCGALREWARLSQEEQSAANTHNLFSLMDLHAITQPQRDLPAQIFHSACALLACGIKPGPRTTIFVQSDVRQHSELAWVLTCIAPVNRLARMTQFKQKAAALGGNSASLTHTAKEKEKESENEEDEDEGRKSASLGLLSYPVLMAADILLYNTTHVPAGEDQVQHVEFCRYLASHFNRTFGGRTFVEPQVELNPAGKRIMSLQDPLAKMSKSAPLVHSRILLSDDPSTIRSKFAKARTDSLGPVPAFEEVASIEGLADTRPAIANLISTFAACSQVSTEQALRQCAGMNGVQLKEVVSDAVISVVDPIRREMELIAKDRAYVHRVFAEGKNVAESIAETTMSKVRRRVGLGLTV